MENKKKKFSFQVDLSDLEPTTKEERQQQALMRESTTFFKDGMRRLRKNAVAMTSIVVLAIIILAVIFVPMFWPYSYDDQLGIQQFSEVDSSYNDLAPFKYGSTELIQIAKKKAGLDLSEDELGSVKYTFTDDAIQYTKDGNTETLITYEELAEASGYDPDKGDIKYSVDEEKPKYVEWCYANVENEFASIASISDLPEDYQTAVNNGEHVNYVLNDESGTIDWYTMQADDAQELMSLADADENIYVLLSQGSNIEWSTENGELSYREVVSTSWNNLFKMSVAENAIGKQPFPHIFGTDSAGRDYFIRVIYGARISLVVGLFASIIVLIIGTIYGSVSGYFGGKVDLIMMRIVDIIYALPDMLIIILLSVVLKQVLAGKLEGTALAALGANMISIFIVFGLLYWVGMARLIRGQILALKEQEYVLAAQSIGASSGRIIRKHLIPNCISLIIISVALQIPSAIFTESFLSFLGLGVAAPMPSLGSLASDALSGVFSYTYRLVIPALFICLIVLSLNLLGDGLRDAFDPKLKN